MRAPWEIDPSDRAAHDASNNTFDNEPGLSVDTTAPSFVLSSDNLSVISEGNEEENEEPNNLETGCEPETVNGDGKTCYIRDTDRLWTLEEALADPRDMRVVLMTQWKRQKVLEGIFEEQHAFEDLILQHVRSKGVTRVNMFPKTNVASQFDGFNLLFKVHLESKSSSAPKAVLLKIVSGLLSGEKRFPGNVEEKVRCEAATYVYVQRNCPEISVPTLLGFGVPGGKDFFKLEALPWDLWLGWQIRRFWHFCWRMPAPAPYVMRRRKQKTIRTFGYLISDWPYGDEGNYLERINRSAHTETERTNFFRGIARIVMSLARIPQPRIGSWTITDTGIIQLTNRPLDQKLHESEAYRVPTGIPRSRTFSSVNDYYTALLHIHDLRMYKQPNSITSESGAAKSFSDILLARSMMTRMTDPALNYGPFVMQMMSPDVGKFLVDADCNIKYMLDLEWIASIPVEALSSPFEIFEDSGDLPGTHGQPQGIADNLLQNLLEEEEIEQDVPISRRISAVVRQSNKFARTTYFDTIRGVAGFSSFFRLFLPRYPRDREYDSNWIGFFERLSPFFSQYQRDLVHQKLKNRASYENRIKEGFSRQGVEYGDDELQETMDDLWIDEPWYTT